MCKPNNEGGRDGRDVDEPLLKAAGGGELLADGRGKIPHILPGRKPERRKELHPTPRDHTYVPTRAMNGRREDGKKKRKGKRKLRERERRDK